MTASERIRSAREGRGSGLYVYDPGTGRHSIDGLRACQRKYEMQAVDERLHPSTRRAARRYGRNIDAMIALAAQEGRIVSA